jgi:hypothetical protein
MKSTRAAICVFALLAALSLAVLSVDARMCTQAAQSSVWKHDKGSFKRMPGTNPPEWREYDSNNVPSKDVFVESLREGTAIVIHDKKRNIKVLLKDGVAGLQNSEAVNRNDGNFAQLYAGNFVVVMDCTQ